uniref:EOG090X0BDJ n=1 Tax=Daphnia atkinsoni TaxID=342845 RepID=A0A4Y7M1X0_9CRUS|nr:EOG090X0BDJ [Daphnia atkinsoni]
MYKMAKVDRKRFECNALPKGWTREEVVRKAGLSAGTKDIFYYSPNGKKFRSKPQLVRHLGDGVDLTTFDYKTGKVNAILLRKNRKKAQPDLARGFRNDLSVIPPIRQTASIFKQPVTIVKSQECKVRHELKHGRQEKPRQLFWEKRLENLKFLNSETEENSRLPPSIKPIGPNVNCDTALQSLVSSLHTVIQGVSITGQTGSKSALEKNAGVFLNPDQPLVQGLVISESDIRKQEERVLSARVKLQEALRSL